MTSHFVPLYFLQLSPILSLLHVATLLFFCFILRYLLPSLRKIFEAFDGETIAAMDPESFAEYLASQSLLDMMANADTVGDENGDGKGDWEGCRDREGGWNRDTDTTHKANFISI